MLTQEHLTYLASLIKLNPNKKDINSLKVQYTAILDYLDIVSTIETKDVEPLFTPIEKTNTLRSDIPISYEKPENLLKNAPETKEHFFVVPCII